MAPLAKKTIQHFIHPHPLREVSADTEFLCGGCETLGVGKRYRCEPCDFNLHDHCGTCPMELSSFMHDHSLKLVVRKPRGTRQIVVRKPRGTRQIDRACDLCGDFVEGLFYRCSLCDFDVHPTCTQLPQEVRHVMHKEHPLRLQRSVPGRCMVCYNTCASWHYRCGICCFDLHLECVLAPCEEATTTSTARSVKTSIPSPSSPSPAFSAYHGYGYGAVPPPPNFAYAYGVPLAPPYSVPYANGHAIPSTSSQINVQCQHINGSQGQGQEGGAKARKKMYAVAGKLAVGVLGNVVFGTIGTLFAS